MITLHTTIRSPKRRDDHVSKRAVHDDVDGGIFLLDAGGLGSLARSDVVRPFAKDVNHTPP